MVCEDVRYSIRPGDSHTLPNILAVTCGGNDEVNARLIAAAPELLAACEALDEWEKNPSADGMAELAAIILAARRAIAPAKGEYARLGQ